MCHWFFCYQQVLWVPCGGQSFFKLGTRARPQWCKYRGPMYHIVVQGFRCVWFFVTPWTAAHQAPLSFTTSWSLLKFMSSESVMLSNHLILCYPLLLLPSIFPSIRLFSNESALHIRWPKDSSFSLSISLPMNTQDWSPLGWTGWISLQSKGLSRVFSNTTVQKHQFFGSQPSLCSNSSVHDYWKNHSFDYTDLCQQSDISAF